MHTRTKTKYFIILMVMLILTTSAQPARAIPVGVIANAVQIPFDIGTLIENTMIDIADTASWLLEIFADIKENVLDPAAWVYSKIQIHDEANTILTQVRGGGNARGETGGALFVTDWTRVSNTAVSNQRKFF